MLLWAFATVSDGPICDHTFNCCGHVEQSNTIPVTRPNRRARRDPDGWHWHSASAQITLDSSVLLLFRAFIHFEGCWACLVLVVIDTTDKAHSTQLQSLAIVGKRTTEEREKEEEEEDDLQLKRKDRGQGAKCLPRKSRRSVSCSLLQLLSLFRPKIPRVDLLGSLWIFYQRKACSVFSQKRRTGLDTLVSSAIFWDFLKATVGREQGFDWRLTGWSRSWSSAKKKFKVPTLPNVNFSFLFFFQKIDERLNEIRRSRKSCTSRSIDFTHGKLKTRSMPFTMYGRECGSAWPNLGLWPFAGRPPVKSKCMGFAGYFAQWRSNEHDAPGWRTSGISSRVTVPSSGRTIIVWY